MKKLTGAAALTDEELAELELPPQQLARIQAQRELQDRLDVPMSHDRFTINLASGTTKKERTKPWGRSGVENNGKTPKPKWVCECGFVAAGTVPDERHMWQHRVPEPDATCSRGCQRPALVFTSAGVEVCSIARNQCWRFPVAGAVDQSEFTGLNRRRLYVPGSKPCENECGGMAMFKLWNGRLCCTQVLSDCPKSPKRGRPPKPKT